MTLWLIRAGKTGQREALALENNVAVVGWEELPDMTQIAQRSDLKQLLSDTYEGENPKVLSNWESQLWPILSSIQAGDLVALPLKGRSAIAVGRVTGPYAYRTDLVATGLHTRPVHWLKEFPRTDFDQDLRYSLGAFMTVCRIQRNQAEARVKAMLEGKKSALPAAVTDDDAAEAEDAPPDLEQYARDQIRDFISMRYKGHGLSHLVAAILKAQGYQTHVSPEGPDGGVDIIAGKGLLGFDPPRLAVQVKSGDGPIDVKVLRELQGVMKNFGSEQGLIVAWGGYRQSVAKEGARLFFEIRLWDSDDLVKMLLAHYDDLPDSVQAELPLKRIWTLVPDGE